MGDVYSLPKIGLVIDTMVMMLKPTTIVQTKTMLMGKIKLGDKEAKTLLQATPGSLGPALERAVIALADSLYLSLRNSIRMSLFPNLLRAVNNTVSHTAFLALAADTNQAIIDALTPTLNKALLSPVLNSTASLLVSKMSTDLLPSLALTVARSVRRRPMDDYLCYYCGTKKLYCRECHQATTRYAVMDSYVNYYSRFYSGHYTRFFAAQEFHP